jgi:2'-hydroxyisoflavone reductase
MLGQPRRTAHLTGYGTLEPHAPRALEILILGGTGFLGPHEVHLALERGHSVTIFNRGRTEPRMFLPDFDHVERLVGDREDDLAALEGRRWDVVIDNSTRSPGWAEATVDLLRDSANHYVFVSSTGIYYPYLTTNISESVPVLTEDTRGGQDGSMAYGVMKANAEEAARSGFGDRAIILRPGHIAGPGDTQPNRFPYWTTRMERGGEILAPGMKSDPTQLVDVRDLIGFMFHLFESGQGGTLNVTGPASPMPMEEFLYGIRACTGEPVSWVWVDDHEWLAENRLGAAIPWILPVGDEVGHMSIDASRSLAAGLTLRPLARTVFDVIDWWHSEAVGPEIRDNVRFPLTSEREAELIAAWRASR